MLEIDITALLEGWGTNRVEHKITLTRIGNSLPDGSRNAYHVARQNIGWFLLSISTRPCPETII